MTPELFTRRLIHTAKRLPNRRIAVDPRGRMNPPYRGVAVAAWSDETLGRYGVVWKNTEIVGLFPLNTQKDVDRFKGCLWRATSPAVKDGARRG